MKTRLLLLIVMMFTLLAIPKINFGQINLGAASNFVLYSTGGAVHDNPSSHSLVTGDVGYFTSGNFLGFGNVNGVMHPGVDAATTACESALQSAVTQINGTTNDYFPGLLLGNGVVFTPGVYSIPGNATLNLNLILDAQNVSSAQFIIKIQGTLSTTAAAKVKLINGAQACNVFWLVGGQVDMATNTTMRGTVIAVNAAINMATGDSIEGRLLSTTGAITIDGITAFTPTGCGSSLLAGPTFPTMGSIACYAIYSSNGALTNTAGTTTSIGDVGNNGIGSISGWSAGDVTGALHLIQDPSTIQAAIDLSNLYDTLNAMVPDIELLYPAQFGNNLVLTPHVYVMNSAATFTNSIYLDAQGNSNAVFVIKISGGSPALTTSTYANVHLINGAQAKNVFWLVYGAVNINNYSDFNGNIVVPNGAINLVNTGVVLNGRALTMVGAITTSGLTAIMPPGCSLIAPPLIVTEPTSETVCLGDSVTFSVIATGTALTYQWRKDTINLINGGNISGATSAMLTINPVTILDTASNYNVIVSGASAPNDTSVNISLKLNNPVIVSEPISADVCLGSSAFFSVTSTGTNLTYQWRKGNDTLINGGNISGTKSATLTINPVSINDTASNYNVIVSGVCLPKDTSVNVYLKLSNPVIVNQPISKQVCLGDSTFFSVNAIGVGLTYQWRKGSVNLIDAGNISGANSATLKINPVSITDTASNYNVIVSGICLPNDTSVNVYLELSNPIIISEPFSQTAMLGDSVYFSVTATGVGLNYQWKRGNVNLINGGNISGATTATLIINPVNITDTASNYNVVVSGICLPNDTSINVSLSICTPPVITTEPSNKSVCLGNSAFLTVTATGTNLTYQWRKGNVNMINSANISGVNSNTLTFNPADLTNAAGNYNVIVSGGCLPNDTSINASLLVDTVVTIITQPVNKTVCVGSSVYFSVVASGSGNTYQWRKGTVNLVNGGNISGATSDTLRINPATLADTAYNYNVVVTGLCSSVNSNLTNLNSAGGFGILAGVGISSTGFSVISDMNIGISPGVRSSITGFPPASVVNGAIYASDDVAPPGVAAMLIQAKQDLTNAYLFAEGATAPAPVTVAGDQGGITLAPGIYKSTSTLLIQSGNLTLDGQGNANAVWIFQVASDFTTVGGAGGSVILTGGAQAKNVTWQIGSSATIGNGTSFKGNILALTSITMNTGSSIDGRLLARNGAVVLSGTNIINNPSATSANGSTLTSTIVSLVVNPLPVTSLISGNATPNCNAIGEIYSVINTAGSTYAWTVPTGAIITAGGGTSTITVTFGTTNGNISVIETNSNGCVGSQVSKTITLQGCGLIANFTANITSVCSGSSVIFTNTSLGTTPTTTYSWNFGNGATPATISGIGPHTVIYSGTGTSTVSLTITDGASNTKTMLNYITINPINTIILTSALGTNNQTQCINTPIVNITYATTGATGATFTVLPAGITASWLANVVTISGTPTATGVFNYTVNLTGGCGIVTATGTITITPNNTIVLTSAIGTNNQTLCINTAVVNITYATTGSTGVTFSGLPAGITANWLANVVTISGTPTASGTYNYTVNLTGGCGIISATGTITVTPNNTIVLTSAVGTNNQIQCINTAITNITYTTTGATGATFSGLPAGITANWLANVVTISGTPTATGVFNYTVNLTGSCGIISTTGTITVTPNNTIVLTSAVGTNNQTKCINTAITNITYTTTGATGATFSGLPAGITANWLANVVTISGTPTASGIFNYTVNLTGGCGTISATGTITVTPNNTIVLTSAVSTNNQTLCLNTAITNITYTTTGATGATFSGLPAGITANWLANVVTISGTPTASGIFNYTVNLTGGCGTISATGTITVSPINTIVLTSAAGTNNQILCVNTPVTNITYATTGATGATFSGLPAGITANWFANVVTISGTPTVTGIFNYTVNLTSGCGAISINGTITVNSTIGATSFILGATSVCQNAPDETYTATATSSTSIVYSVLPVTAGVINSTTGVMNWDVNFSGVATITAISTGLCGTTTANRVVTVILLPIAVASSNSPVCVNSPLNLTAQTVTGGSYSWTGPNSFTSIVQNPVIISAILANAGNYTLTVTANGCASLPSTIAVVVNVCPSDLSVVKTVNISNPLKGTSVIFTIVATNNGPYTATGVIVTDNLQSGYTFVSYTSSPSGVYNPVTGIWTIGNLGIGASSTLYITAIVNLTGSYVNTATITGNEIDVILTNNTSTIETIPTDFFIPQGFSPNGDGINDLFVIRGIELYPANSIVIYNRWGNKVFDASPYQNTWDGKTTNGLIIGEGDRLPIGTYFYLLNLGNNSDVIKGTIYLNK